MIPFLYYLTLLVFNPVSSLPTAVENTPNVRIYGGETAAPGQFPFIVSIDVVDFGHFCGGSIINENWIVAAAHCTINLEPVNYTVLAGTNLLDSGGTIFSVEKIVRHPNYVPFEPADDIVLFKIQGTFTFDNLVRPIEIGQVSGNDSVTVIGWGQTEETVTSNALLYANLTALSNDECVELSVEGDYVYPVGPGQVCALASKGVSPCHGDSGGPLISDGRLVGVVSYAVSPCAKGFPDVYSRVSYYIDWINDVIKNN